MRAFIAAEAPAMSCAARPSNAGARYPTAAIMLSTVSPVMVGAEAASPQPMMPLSASTRTSTLSAALISTPAITTGFFIGKLTAIASTRLIFTLQSPQSDHLLASQLCNCVGVQSKLAGEDFIVV